MNVIKEFVAQWYLSVLEICSSRLVVDKMYKFGVELMCMWVSCS